MIYNSHHDYLFVHIQKTAGTSISKFLLENAHSHYVSPSHIRLRDLIFLGPKRPFIFAVVRNPWERLVSWYEMMIRKGIHNDFSRYLLTPSSKNRVDQPVGFSEFIRRTDVITENTLPESQRQINNTNSDTLKDSPFHFQDNFTYTKSLSYNQLDYLCSADGNLLFDAALSF